jgi:hypothetical protein
MTEPGPVPPSLEAAVRDFRLGRSIPVDLAVAAAFLRTAPWQGRVAVAPAGWLTRNLLEPLGSADGVELVGIIDRHPDLASGDVSGGISTVGADRWHELDADHFLILHTRRAQEIRGDLLAAGVPSDRIHIALSHPEYRERFWRAARLSEALDGMVLRRREALARIQAGPVAIVQTSERQVILDQAIAGALPPEDVLVVSLMAEGYEGGGHFLELSAYGSVEILERILRDAAPRAVYLRTSLDSHLLFPLVRQWLPDARIVAEPYDIWALFGGDQLAIGALMAATETEVAGHRLAECSLLADADMVISKRSGPVWESFAAPLGGRYLPYCAGVFEASPKAPSPTGDRIRIVDATALESPSVLAANPAYFGGYDNLTAFEDLAARLPLDFTIFNLLHRGPEDDATFHRYLSAFATRPVIYRRRVRAEDLPSVFADFDYGWLNFSTQTNPSDMETVLPNRFCSYIGAGLPVMVSEHLPRVAELVREYSAGIVIAPDDRGLTDAIQHLEPQRHRAGALALRQHLLATNRQTLAELETLLAPAGDEP